MIKKIAKSIIPEKTRLNIREGFLKLKAPLYAGDNVTCNCCEKSFRTFIPKGNIERQNAKCPYCGSLERTRLLYAYLQNETTIFTKPSKLLHIAPESCLADIFRKTSVDYIDGDINPTLASTVVDLTAMQFANNTFDMIICSHVLGHIPDEAKAIREMKRVLKPTGTAIIMTVIDLKNDNTFEDASIVTDEDRLLNYGEHDLVRRHGLDFGARLKVSGFRVKEIDYRDHFSKEEKKRFQFGNGERELIFRCF